MMQLPKYKPVEKKTLKYCDYMECGKEFFGRPIQKYCDFHTDPHHRKRIRHRHEGPAIKNQIFMHHFKDKTKIEFECALEGCGKDFEVDVYPKLYVYPKYCEHHRNEFQREHFMRNIKFQMAS